MIKSQFEKVQKVLNDMGNKMKIEYLHGYLTAVLCAPEMIPPSKWLYILTKDQKGNDIIFDSTEQTNLLIMPVMGIYNDIADSLVKNSYKPLFSLDNIKITPEIAETWSTGFVTGLNLWGKGFVEDKDLRDMIFPIMILSGSDVINESLFKTSISDEEKNLMKKEIIAQVSKIIMGIRLYNQPKSKSQNTGKVGRNVKCPCGSGKKYKYCCG